MYPLHLHITSPMSWFIFIFSFHFIFLWIEVFNHPIFSPLIALEVTVSLFILLMGPLDIKILITGTSLVVQ